MTSQRFLTARDPSLRRSARWRVGDEKITGMKSDAVWALLLGAAVALASTLLRTVGKLGLPDQTATRSATGRLPTLRSSPGPRSAPELSEAMGGVAAVRYEATKRADWDGALPSDHPAVAAVRSLADRLEIVAAAVEDQQLRATVDQVARRAHIDAITSTDGAAQDDESAGLARPFPANQVVSMSHPGSRGPHACLSAPRSADFRIVAERQCAICSSVRLVPCWDIDVLVTHSTPPGASLREPAALERSGREQLQRVGRLKSIYSWQ